MSCAFAYARVSTEEQDLDMQMREVEEWARRNNVQIIKWFVDHGVSGALPLQERSGFRQLIQELNTIIPRPKLLLVYDITRLARSFLEFVRAWHFIETQLDLVLVPIKDVSILSIPPEYRYMLKFLLALFADLEREFIRRRTRDGMKRLKAEGKITNIVERLKKENPDLLTAICREYMSGEPKYRLAKKYSLSKYAVDRIIREYCGYNQSMSCPRCQHLLTVEKRYAEFVEGQIRVKVRYYCRKCGFLLEVYE